MRATPHRPHGGLLQCRVHKLLPQPLTLMLRAVILKPMNARLNNNWWWLNSKERAAG